VGDQLPAGDENPPACGQGAVGVVPPPRQRRALRDCWRSRRRAGYAGGLVALPYFAGERATLFDSYARGVLAGLTLAHTRAHVYRALLEGTAFAVRHAIEVMARPAAQRRLRGRGRHEAAACGRRSSPMSSVGPRAQVEGAGYGAAALPPASYQFQPFGAVWDRTGASAPADGTADVYDRLYAYRELYRRRSPVHALAALR
jgi:xylulokinase